MNKEDLLLLKQKIGELNEKEKYLRDLYLRQISNGEVLGPQTGYRSIDKPWLQHYEKDAINYNTPNTSMYEYMKTCAKDYLDTVAITFFGKKITYNEVLKNIDNISKSLMNLDIKKGDRVVILEGCTPEALYLVYAINKIGAISVPLDPRMNEKQLNNAIKENDPTLIVSLDLCQPLLDKIDTKGIKLIYLSATESAPKLIRLIDNISKKKNKYKKEYIDWDTFVNNDKNKMVIDNITVDENDVAAIIYTGGTTGVKKGVKLTNKNFNSLAYYHQICGIPHSHGQKMLNFMPPFIAYGVVDGMHMPLCVGWTIDMQPKFEFCDFPKTVEKGKYNILMASPVHYEFMQKYKSNKDFSFLDMAISGGDSMSKEFEIKMNKWFKEHNSDIVLGQGLGMTEASSVMTLPFPNKIKTGSVGFPFSITNMGIFEPGTTNEVVGNEQGEICFYGDTIMKGYLNNSDDEKKVLIEHEDGKKWLHSGDIGFIDDEGYVFIVNRIKRIINRNGLKVFPSEIEKIAMKHPNVDMAVAVGVENEKERNVPILHLSLKNIEETNKTINEIIDMCREALFEEYIPYGIKIRTQFPYTDNGKMDYIKLASEQYEGVIITKKISKVYTLKK